MTPHFDKLGIRFQYPEGWTLADEQLDEWPRSISVQSPGGGFWSVHVYPAGSDPQQLTLEALQAMRREYEDFESEVLVDDFDGQQAVGYQMDFYCLDFLVTAHVLGYSSAGSTAVMVFQAETREFEQLLPVFRAIAFSFVRGSEPAV